MNDPLMSDVKALIAETMREWAPTVAASVVEAGQATIVVRVGQADRLRVERLRDATIFHWSVRRVCSQQRKMCVSALGVLAEVRAEFEEGEEF